MNDIFNAQGYLQVNQAITSSEAELIGTTLLLAEKFGQLTIDNGQVVGATCVHGHPVTEATMLKIHPLMEKTTGLKLIPTYSFARVYRKGDVLVKHTDRPSCEISATLTLTYKSDKIWPIFVESPTGEEKSILLDKGDLMIYRGCERPHYRGKFEDDMWIQVFCHYVDMSGPYVEYALDQRFELVGLYKTIQQQLMSGKNLLS